MAKRRYKGNYLWQEDWLNERITLLPSDGLRTHIEGRILPDNRGGDSKR